MTSGTNEVPAGVGPGHDRDDDHEPDQQQQEAGPDDRARPTSPGSRPASERDGEHAERQRRDRETGLHRVVLEHHLQVDRQHDHRPAEGDLLEHLAGDPEPEELRLEQVRIDQRGLACALAAHEPPGERAERDGPDREQRRDGLAALLPDQDPEDDAAHAEDRQDPADRVDLPRARVRRVLHEPDAGQHDHDDHDLAGEGEPPRQVGRDETADERADGRSDRRRRADQRIDLPLGGALEVAVDQRLHRGQEERRAEPADDRPEDDDRREALGDASSPTAPTA